MFAARCSWGSAIARCARALAAAFDTTGGHCDVHAKARVLVAFLGVRNIADLHVRCRIAFFLGRTARRLGSAPRARWTPERASHPGAVAFQKTRGAFAARVGTQLTHGVPGRFGGLCARAAPRRGGGLGGGIAALTVSKAVPHCPATRHGRRIPPDPIGVLHAAFNLQSRHVGLCQVAHWRAAARSPWKTVSPRPTAALKILMCGRDWSTVLGTGSRTRPGNDAPPSRLLFTVR